MVVQYPHTLTAKIISESYQDDDGNWVLGVDYTRAINCRVEVPINASGKQVALSDGSVVTCSWVVYMPKGTTPLPNGTLVTVNCSPGATGRVLRFSQGQLNSRLWL